MGFDLTVVILILVAGLALFGIAFVIGFKNNQEIEVECTSFEIKRNALEQITCLSWDGLKDKKPLWMDVSQILYIYKKLEEEEIK